MADDTFSLIDINIFVKHIFAQQGATETMRVKLIIPEIKFDTWVRKTARELLADPCLTLKTKINLFCKGISNVRGRPCVWRLGG